MFYVYLLVQVISITMGGMNNRLHAKQTDCEQRSKDLRKKGNDKQLKETYCS